MRRVQHFVRSGILRAVALAALCLAGRVAWAGTVNAVWNSASDVPVTANGYTATGNTVSFTLNFAPATGTDLMVVSNTALGFIDGTFDNLTNGQPVAFRKGTTTYNFVANYFGGSGNDLVLVWANNQAFAWGDNESGQLGNNTWSWGVVPVAVNTGSNLSALYGQSVVAIAAGHLHSLALCADGTVAAWGANTVGELGDNHGGNYNSQSPVPVGVNTNSGVSALQGKTVVAIAAGWSHSLALCADGTVAAWGNNNYGQVGDNTKTNRLAPVAVDTSTNSALYGKTVVAIAAGSFHNLALCSDGSLAAWGYNSSGQLGDNTTTNRLVPVAVNSGTNSALYGRTVVAIGAGREHSVAFCSDGTMGGGDDFNGALGDNNWTNRSVPVAVYTSHVPTGRRFTRVLSGPTADHTLALEVIPFACDITLMGARKLADGSFQFTFTNTPGALFTVLGTTNPALPCSNLIPLNWVGEVSPGQFQFTEPRCGAPIQRFYRIRSPLRAREEGRMLKRGGNCGLRIAD